LPEIRKSALQKPRPLVRIEFPKLQIFEVRSRVIMFEIADSHRLKDLLLVFGIGDLFHFIIGNAHIVGRGGLLSFGTSVAR